MKDAEKQIEENLRAAGVSEYEKIDLQAYEKQADKLVKQLKKYQKDYEYVTFESNIHGICEKRMWKESGNSLKPGLNKIFRNFISTHT